MSAENKHRLEDEPLRRARPCSVCRGMIPVTMPALVYRNEHGCIEACAYYHLYCRARLREEFLIVSEDCGEYVN